jgi:hypothetical protein
MIVTDKACRVCGGRLDTLLSLGDLYPSHFRLPSEPLPSKIPLDYCACRICRLVQLRHTVEADALFRQYWYLSGVNEVMRAELADVVRMGLVYVGAPRAGEYVLDVGANDGTLLAEYDRQAPDAHILRVAVEPADNLQAALATHCEIRLHGFFPACCANPLANYKNLEGHVKILTSIACVYAADDPRSFVTMVRRLLHHDGVWIVQFQDLHQMTEATAFDNITYEHLIYYSLASFGRLLEGSGLRIVSVDRRAINGGSLRLYIRHAGFPAGRSVDELLQAEQGCEDWDTLVRFGWRVGVITGQIRAAVEAVQRSGGVIDGYGASTKFNTLAQVVGLGPGELRQIWERSPEKVGRLMATGVPIVSEEDGRLDPPAALLAGLWQFRDHVIAREAEYLAEGKAMIFPLPAVDIVKRTA